jgi:hypothetical protein
MATPELSVPTVGASGEPCTACGAPLAADQKYCLNCGDRRAGVPLGLEELAPAPTAPAADAQAAAATPPTQRSIPLTPTTAAAGVGALLVAVLIGAGIAGITSKTPQVNVPAAKAPVVNVAGGAGAASDTAAATPVSFTSDWAGEDGWTIQLQTLPKDGTDAAAVQAAKDAATGKGAADVGALDSDEYPSLDPGNYVVYSGVYATKKEATAALKGVKADFPDAEVVKVSSSEGASADDAAAAAAATGAKSADTADSKELEQLNNASGDKYVEESKKLKDTTAIEGAPPPKDNKPAGGGDDGETIG